MNLISTLVIIFPFVLDFLAYTRYFNVILIEIWNIRYLHYMHCRLDTFDKLLVKLITYCLLFNVCECFIMFCTKKQFDLQYKRTSKVVNERHSLLTL